MLQLRGFEHKFLPPYSRFFNGIECMFSEWKNYVKVGLQGHRARDEEDLHARIRAFQLDPAHTTAYCRHIVMFSKVTITLTKLKEKPDESKLVVIG